MKTWDKLESVFVLRVRLRDKCVVLIQHFSKKKKNKIFRTRTAWLHFSRPVTKVVLKPCFHGYDLKPSRSRSVGDHLLANSLKSIRKRKNLYCVGKLNKYNFSAAKYDERKWAPQLFSLPLFLLITLQEAGYKLMNAISWLIADVWAHNKGLGRLNPWQLPRTVYTVFLDWGWIFLSILSILKCS